MNDSKIIICPFCNEDDFDLIGLKIHFERNWCESYNQTPVEHEFNYKILAEAESGD